MQIVIFYALMWMLKIVLPLKLILGPLGGYSILRHVPGGGFTSFLLAWGYPALVVGIFMARTRLSSRYTPSFAAPCLVVGCALGFVADIAYFAATLVEGGGMAFIVGPYAALVALPARVLIFVGVIKMFLTLKPGSASYLNPSPGPAPRQTSSVENPKRFRQATSEIK